VTRIAYAPSSGLVTADGPRLRTFTQAEVSSESSFTSHPASESSSPAAAGRARVSSVVPPRAMVPSRLPLLPTSSRRVQVCTDGPGGSVWGPGPCLSGPVRALSYVPVVPGRAMRPGAGARIGPGPVTAAAAVIWPGVGRCADHDTRPWLGHASGGARRAGPTCSRCQADS
jgi:hypothetical protein